MKSGTEGKLKFKQLQRRFELELWQARGLLDTLWKFSAENAPRGDIGRFTDEEIAVGLDWRRDPEDLIKTLVDLKWVDRAPAPSRLLIHDWPEHCEHTVHNALARRLETFADGTIPSMSRLTEKERSQLKAKYELKYGKEAVESGRVLTNAQERSETLLGHAPAIPSLAIPSHTIPSQEGGAASPPLAGQDPEILTPPAPPALPARNEPPSPPAPAEKEPRAEDVPLPPELSTPEFLAARAEWFEQRRRNRLSLREKYLTGMYARLLPLGPQAAAACLRHSVGNDYDGVFPEKFGGRGSRARVGSGQTHNPKAAEADPDHGKF